MLPVIIAPMSVRISPNRVTCDDHIKVLGSPHEIHTCCVHKQRFCLYIGILCSHSLEGCIPYNHAVALCVRLGDRSDFAFLVPCPRLLEGVGDNAFTTVPRKYANLHADLFGEPLVLKSTDIGIFTFCVLSYHDQINLPSRFVLERCVNARDRVHSVVHRRTDRISVG